MKKFTYVIMAVLAIAIGLYPSIYFIIQQKFGLLQSKTGELLADPVWKAAFYTHITLGGIALLIGWIQFNDKLRKTKPRTHRLIGKIYITAVFVSALAAIYISFFATGGWIAASGFGTLGIIWFSTTLFSYVQARKQEFEAHRNAMVFSYAACFAAVTLRIYLPLLIMLFGSFIPAYLVVSWLCWVPNMIVAWWIVNKMKDEKVVRLSRYSVSSDPSDILSNTRIF
jgi:uncharacterized membrane protein